MYPTINDYVLTPNIAVAQSLTNQVVSKVFPISRSGSKHLRVKVGAYNVTAAASITCKLQHHMGETNGKFTFVDGDVTTGTDNIAETGHGLATGDTCILTTSGTLPAGLSLLTTYYVIRVDADNIKLAATAELAAAGTAVNITAAAGGGNHVVNYTAIRWVTQSKTGTTINANGDFYILFKAEVAGDQADLPLMSTARVVVTTGAGDAVTIGSVGVLQGS